MKRFWKKTEGFTLVELIVVIAILGILAGVGTVGYSGYIKKANMAADQQLVSSVANALQLHYYGDPTSAVASYVVMTQGGSYAIGESAPVSAAEGEDTNPDAAATEFASEAMVSAFGESWRESVVLKGSNWGMDDGMMELLADYSTDDLELITNSSYLTKSNPASLMQAVNKMTGLASTVIAGSNMANAENNLKLVLGEENAAPVIETLKNFDLMTNSDAISNMLVNAMADSLSVNPALQLIVNEYAAAFAYAEETGDDAALLKMQENLENVTMAALTDENDALDMLYNDMDGVEYDNFFEYIDEAFYDGTLEKDQNALTAMMGAVKEISGNFRDKDSLTNPELYTTEGVMAQVNSYFNSVKALAGMSEDAREVLRGLTEAVVVFVSADGTVAVYPGDVWAA